MGLGVGRVARVLHMMVASRRSGGVVEFARFSFVGAAGVIINLSVGIIMHRINGGTVNGDRPVLALGQDTAVRYRNIVFTLSFFCAAISNFQMNRSWTFRTSPRTGWWRSMSKYLAISTLTLIVGLAFHWAMTHPGSLLYLSSRWFTEAEGMRSREYWSHLIAVLVTMPVNYVLNKTWTFRASSAVSENPT